MEEYKIPDAHTDKDKDLPEVMIMGAMPGMVLGGTAGFFLWGPVGAIIGAPAGAALTAFAFGKIARSKRIAKTMKTTEVNTQKPNY